MNESTILGQIAARDQERIRGYQELLDFYNGKQWFGRERAGEKRLTFNYAKIFVDKITSYLMSGINFTVEALEDTPEARALAVEAEKSLSRVYDANNLMQLDLETETDCAILGDGCYKVTWDQSAARVRVTAPDIQGIQAWWMGDDMSRIWRVSSKYTLSSEEAGILYPNLKLTTHDSKLITVLELWTDSDFELYLDGVLADHKPNPYSFIPFIIYPNLRDPKKFWGTSDLCPIIEPQRELNRAMSQVSHILELSGNPVAVLQNVEESSDISVRPGAVWNIPEDAKAYLLDLLQGGGLQLHINYIELLYRVLHDISEAPRAAFGGMDRALSGVAMQIELYPLLQKILRKRAIRSTVYNRRSRMILDLLAKFSPSPQLAASSSKLEASPDFHVRTVWGQILPQDMEKLVANEQVLVQTGIHSRRRAMDEVGVKDPEAEFAHWKEEQEQIKKL
jgi:Phage portal protein, SPP1 Gp6-like